ncbi:MAG: TonB-dependent receptor, partial [Bacteroidetes bacterium]
HLRKGNDERFEYTAQASLIGIDAAAEGPISREKRSSFLVNYRYSFTGLLGLMGVTFGGEAITFQDLSFNLSFPTEKAGTFTVFGMGGMSSNRFKAPRTDSLRETGKDRFDINFYSNMAAGGITHRILLGEKTVLRSVVAVSTIDSKRDAFYLQDDNETLSKVEYDQLGQTKLSLTSALTHKFSGRSSLTLGAYATQNYSTTLSESRPLPGNSDFLTLADFGGSAWLFQPYANWTFTPASRLTIQAGVHGMFYLLNNSKSIEPRLSLEWNPALRHSLRLAYGLHSQLQLPTLYFSAFRDADGAIVRPNINLGFTRAHHAVLSYSLRLSEILHLRAEPYFQYLFDVPVLSQPGSTFSALNLLESQVNDSLVNEGLGRNYGLELSLERWLRDSWYYVFSGSLYQSQYQASDGIWRDT